MLATLESEAERLNRFVANLLDMTRLEAGAIEIRLDLVDVAEIVGVALQRAGSVLARHRIEVELAPDLPMLRLDAILFEQVLFNLLDNAAKYAPQGSRIDLRAGETPIWSRSRSIDEGPAFRPTISNGSSISSTASMPRIGAAPAQVRVGDLPRVRRGSRGRIEAQTGATARARS